MTYKEAAARTKEMREAAKAEASRGQEEEEDFVSRAPKAMTETE